MENRFKQSPVGKMPIEWEMKTVSELINDGIIEKPLDGNHGGIHPKQSDFVPYGIPFIMASDLKNGLVNYKSCKFISEEQAKTLKKGFAKERDILITHKATIGETAIVKKIKTEYIVLTPQVTYYRVKDSNKLDSKYLMYYFNYKGFKNLFCNWAGSGSTRAYLGITAQQKLPIVIPSIEQQKKIASILSSLDNKIQLNNEMNKTLEEIAKATFKSWFVDFQPFKDGEFEKSELGTIPKGWKVKSLYDLANYINGTSFKKHEYSKAGIPIIKIAELKAGIGSTTKYFSGDKDEKFYLNDREILFSWSGNPDTSIDIFLWYRGEAILNQHIFKVVPYEKNDYCYIYLLLKYFKSTFANIARNKQTTGLGHVTVKDLKELKFVYNKDSINRFNCIVEPIIKRIFNNYKSNEIVCNIRDSLLQKLISGEIKLK